MSEAQTGSADTAAQDFFAVQTLLSRPSLAFLYTDLLVHSPTTVGAARERTGIERSTAYKYANELAELGAARETDERVDGAALWQASPLVGTWNGAGDVEVSPTMIAVYGASDRDDDLALFRDRHGTHALVPAVEATLSYLRGERTRRGVADALGVPATEGIAVSQSIERVVAAVAGVDPTLEGEAFAVETHERTVADCPYVPVGNG